MKSCGYWPNYMAQHPTRHCHDLSSLLFKQYKQSKSITNTRLEIRSAYKTDRNVTNIFPRISARKLYKSRRDIQCTVFSTFINAPPDTKRRLSEFGWSRAGDVNTCVHVMCLEFGAAVVKGLALWVLAFLFAHSITRDRIQWRLLKVRPPKSKEGTVCGCRVLTLPMDRLENAGAARLNLGANSQSSPSFGMKSRVCMSFHSYPKQILETVAACIYRRGGGPLPTQTPTNSNCK